MLPVCSATPCCSSHSQIPFYGGFQSLYISRKISEVKCILEDKNDVTFHGVSFKTQVTKPLYSHFVGGDDQSSSINIIDIPSCQNHLDNLKCRFSIEWSYPIKGVNDSDSIVREDFKFVESSGFYAAEEDLANFTKQLTENTNSLLGAADPETISTIDVIPDNPTSGSKSLDMNTDSLMGLKTNVRDLIDGVTDSIGASANKGENALKKSLDMITSSITSAIESATETVDSAVSEVFYTVDRVKEVAGNRLTSFSSDLKEAAGMTGVIAVDVLRRTIVAVEDSLTNGAAFVVYSYGSAKEQLPLEIRTALNLSEGKVIEILRPAASAIKQVYSTVEGLEKGLGLDPNDPLVPFIFFLGTSATLWVFYWVFTYSGYSGNLSPESTLEMLRGKEDGVLIDVRPENLRERDGIPDLRRAARFRYANVALPELDYSVRKLLKNGREIDNALIATVIRNLKIVQDRSKVIVLDADGTRSKGICRSLRRLGVKRPYLVQGGFQSWEKRSLRVKDLKPETTLTVLNEEAEAILEDISPTPPKVLGYGLGFIVAVYAILEWETTLQYIGVVGLGQTIYRRVASYNDSEDLKQDIRLLLAPVRLGVQAFSWAAGKLETNRIGLPTSPSSSDVQNRVLQAAAKHESQPSDTEELKDPLPESAIPVNEKVDLSEA